MELGEGSRSEEGCVFIEGGNFEGTAGITYMNCAVSTRVRKIKESPTQVRSIHRKTEQVIRYVVKRKCAGRAIKHDKDGS